MYKYTWGEFEEHSRCLAQYIVDSGVVYSAVYGVPRGGVPLAVRLSTYLGLPIVDEYITDYNILVCDDIVDSGITRDRYPGDFVCLHCRSSKTDVVTFFADMKDDWIVYPWEGGLVTDGKDLITRQLQFIQEDPTREGLLETPARVLKSWEFLFSGYSKDPVSVFKTFESDGYDQLVLLKDIELYSMCEHHMLPFFGKAHVAYIPDKKVIGVSKLARLVDIFSRRLQIQERLGEQVSTALMDNLSCKGAACIINASHLCMRMRGVEKQHSSMVTSSLKGLFLTNSSARQELMSLITKI